MLTHSDLHKRMRWFVLILPFSDFHGGSTGSNPVGGAGKSPGRLASVVPAPTSWQQATVVAVSDHTRRAKTFRLPLSRPTPHRAGRLGAADLDGRFRDVTLVYVCGSTGFANAATDLLVAGGVPAGAIRVERFGPTGT